MWAYREPLGSANVQNLDWRVVSWVLALWYTIELSCIFLCNFLHMCYIYDSAGFLKGKLDENVSSHVRKMRKSYLEGRASFHLLYLVKAYSICRVSKQSLKTSRNCRGYEYLYFIGEKIRCNRFECKFNVT